MVKLSLLKEEANILATKRGHLIDGWSESVDKHVAVYVAVCTLCGKKLYLTPYNSGGPVVRGDLLDVQCTSVPTETTNIEIL